MCGFLLVLLNISAILREVAIRERGKKFEKMTQGDGFNDAYATTLTRLKAQKGHKSKSALGLRVLMWVLSSEQPLRAQELCIALGVEIGSADLDPEKFPALRTLLESFLGLVMAEATEEPPQSNWCTLLFKSIISLVIRPFPIVLTQQLPRFA